MTCLAAQVVPAHAYARRVSQEKNIVLGGSIRRMSTTRHLRQREDDDGSWKEEAPTAHHQSQPELGGNYSYTKRSLTVTPSSLTFQPPKLYRLGPQPTRECI